MYLIFETRDTKAIKIGVYYFFRIFLNRFFRQIGVSNSVAFGTNSEISKILFEEMIIQNTENRFKI